MDSLQTISCSSCSRQLKVPAQAMGKNVKCPVCQTVFKAQPEESPGLGVPPELDHPVGFKSRPSLDAPPIKDTADEPHDEDADESSRRRPDEDGRSLRRRDEEYDDRSRRRREEGDHDRPRRRRDEDDDDRLRRRRDEDDDDYPRRPRRRGYRDLDPHRATLVLVMAILGFMVCGAFGIAAWIMGSADLKAMEEGSMDREGEGMTRAGYIIGMITTILTLVVVILFFLWFVFILAVIKR
jgi:LSD1 subclass zinc finger protein